MSIYARATENHHKEVVSFTWQILKLPYINDQSFESLTAHNTPNKHHVFFFLKEKYLCFSLKAITKSTGVASLPET